MTLDKASDLHKSVISAYRCEAGNESNVATLSSSKFSATTLSSCAVYLGIKVVDTHNVNIFDNKKEVADRIILKIESYFGTHCRDCDSPYRNHFQSPTPPPPLLACHSCFQGSHDCETIKEKAEALEKLVCVIGMVKGNCHG